MNAVQRRRAKGGALVESSSLAWSVTALRARLVQRVHKQRDEHGNRAAEHKGEPADTDSPPE